jgi:hypothetical protein
MRTLTKSLKHMNRFEFFRILEKHTMYPTTLCSFWGNFSGHFARLTCNHSYGYAFRPIEQIDSLKSPQNSAFSCNMRAKVVFLVTIGRFNRSGSKSNQSNLLVILVSSIAPSLMYLPINRCKTNKEWWPGAEKFVRNRFSRQPRRGEAQGPPLPTLHDNA